MADGTHPDGANPAYEALDESIPEEFHFHLYFETGGQDTRESALAVRKRFLEGATFRYQLPPVRERPMGPHRWPIWSIWVDRPASVTPRSGWHATTAPTRYSSIPT